MKNKGPVSLSLGRSITTATLFCVVVIFVLGVVVPALALDAGLQYGTLTGLGTQDIRISVMKIIRYILGFVGVIALIIVLYAGFVWMTSAGNPERIDFAKRTLRNAVIGLIIIFLSFAIVSFIIGVLNDSLTQGPPGGGGPPPSCINCGHLGSGVVESVYPEPYARDVARNTTIAVTFKVPMNPGTIIAGCGAAPCQGDLDTDSVKIFSYYEQSPDPLAAQAATSDGRTYVFYPREYLGDGVNNVWYATTLTNDIKKDNGSDAFEGTFGNSFTWTFEVGTSLDLDPVEYQSVFPIPDGAGDNYSQAIGSQATGHITVTTEPQIAVAASTNHPVTVVSGPPATISGAYSCTVDALICLTAGSGGSTLTISPKSPTGNCSSPNISVPGLSASAALGSGGAALGCQLLFQTNDFVPDGSQYSFIVTAAKSADTLRVANRTYTFVSGTAGSSQIARGENASATAAAIATIIDNDTQSPEVSATSIGSVVTLTAEKIGSEGNNIALTASGTWADLDSFSGGTDTALNSQKLGATDQPRNAVIKLDFNEAIDPTRLTQLDPASVQVQYFNPEASVNDWVDVDGTVLVSNQYQTIEFISNSLCGVCQNGNDGNPCSDDSQCGGGSCELVSNSCGDPIYCLPTVADGNPATTAYDATQYRVVAKAALLQTCTDDASCNDANYSQCIQTVLGVTMCGNGTAGYFYPTAQVGASHIADLASNSFNANKNTYVLNSKTLGNAEGPEAQSGQGPYNLDPALTDADTQGDDLIWSFYINKQVDLSPAHVAQIGPNVQSTGVSLTAPLEMTFDELMLSSTIKPGTGYQDGLCGCQADNDCDTTNGEFCDLDIALINDSFGKCRNADPTKQIYCSSDEPCRGNNICINKKYISLIDQSTSPVGWWASKFDIDVVPQDGYGDITRAQLQHTKLLATTNYGGEIGSGLKDIYQNCYLPSQGPTGIYGVCSVSGDSCFTDIECSVPGERCEGIGRCSVSQDLCASDDDCGPSGGVCGGVCNVTAAEPYCCNGDELRQADWENSECYTGY